MIRARLSDVVMGAAGLAVMLGLQAWFQPLAIDGLYFQAWTSEYMMQTVSIADLATEPLASLWYLHIQPPALDLIRASLAQVALLRGAATPLELLRQVDAGVYWVWTVLYAILGVVLYRWLALLLPRWAAVVASGFFLLHPATIKFAGLLESTFLSALLTTGYFAALWRLRERPSISVWPLAALTVACFLTRSLYQWPFLIVTALALALMNVRRNSIVGFLVISGSCVILYSAKQWALFGTFSSSTFVGYNLVSSIGVRPAEFPTLVDDLPEVSPFAGKAAVLTRTRKLDGRTNYNHWVYIQANQDLLRRYRSRLQHSSTISLLGLYASNARIWLLPSASYARVDAPHLIADRLPWRSAHDAIFSSPVLPVLLLVCGIYWLRGRSLTQRRPGFGFALPLAYIIVVSVVGERSENMRFKFFVEPTLYVLLIASATDMVRNRRARQ